MAGLVIKAKFPAVAPTDILAFAQIAKATSWVREVTARKIVGAEGERKIGARNRISAPRVTVIG